MEGAAMNKIILTLKGILLYTTMIAAMLFIAGIDSIYDNDYFIEAIIIVAGLIYLCYKIINEKEFNTLSFNKFFNKYFKTTEEDDEW